MLRVLEECDKVSADFAADPVHDLRVALRRCRSMADGMKAIDPDRNWKAMKRAGKRVFQRLGALRDVQVMMEWIERLDLAIHPSAGRHEHDADGESFPASQATGAISEEPQSPADILVRILQAREADEKREARAALEAFDRKQWRHWSNLLPRRAGRIRPGSAVFKHLALERWTAARALHTRALKNRSQISFHALRIGIKRFRYIVENFLPVEHRAWANDLKHMQDLLGEVHDLDVLWATAQSCHIFADDESRKAWHGRILEERTKRVEEYCERTSGPDSLWQTWRAGLPQGKQIQQLATRRMKLWAKALDPDFSHSERVARLSLELFDGLAKTGVFGKSFPEANNERGLRSSLYAAGLLHDVGKSQGNKGRHKTSQELIEKHGTPLGWNEEDMRRAGLVARFHCGALPMRRHGALRNLLPEEQREVIRLSAILRLANAMDAEHDGRVRKLRIQTGSALERRTNGFFRNRRIPGRNEPLVISAEGYVERSPTAQAVAAERYLLETVLRRPVMVTALKVGSRHRS
jgi:CHAD domain-containing protein/HD superfamily phosphodiesterase